MKIFMQVHVLYNYLYMKSKKPPRLVCGRQPPRAAAARFALARTRLSSHVDWRQKEALVLLSLLYLYSARGGSCEYGCKNGYKSGLPSAAGFFTLHM